MLFMPGSSGECLQNLVFNSFNKSLLRENIINLKDKVELVTEEIAIYTCEGSIYNKL